MIGYGWFNVIMRIVLKIFVDCGFFRGKFIFINLFFRWIIFVVRRYFFVIFFFD